MLRLEKIFQQDDSLFIDISIFLKSFFVFLLIYVFSILEFYSIFDLSNYNIYIKSNYFYFSLFFLFSYFIFSFIFRVTKKRYVVHYLSFLLNDIVPLLISIPFTLYLLFIFKVDFNVDLNTSYLSVFIILNLFLLRKILDYFYSNLMNNNLIQRNIMLVGSIDSISKILNEKKDKINIYKCCFIKDDFKGNLEKARLNLKIPVFTNESEMRIIQEYHQLGQIWILDNDDKSLVNYFLDTVVKFSVDIIIVNIKDNLKENFKLLSDNLINNNYSYSNYQTSRFYGLNLFFKLLLDKILSIIFLFIISPILILVIFLIYLEDGFPIFFSEESAGWDGRRFSVHKFRIYKKNSLTKKLQINEKEYLKIGKIIEKFRFDEVAQFFNVLKGDMSIVGPRPHILQDDLTYAKVFKMFLKRNKAAPGLTGWAQVSGLRGKNVTSENMKKRMEHDIWYMNNWTIWLDIYIIFKTFYIIFTKPIK
tara:strand:- start:79 stop:1506 length:1428 start_codon:yes stop_codon:yes gene_type:complete